MSQSLVSLSGVSRGRKHHSELVPVLPRDHYLRSSLSPSTITTPIQNQNSHHRIHRRGEFNDNKQETIDGSSPSSARPKPKRAVSMTRLDQLAQPRRRYFDGSPNSGNASLNNTSEPNSMAKSMCNLTSKIHNSSNSNKNLQKPCFDKKGMSTSMIQIVYNKNRIKKDFRENSPHSNALNFTNKEISKSLSNLQSAKSKPPRQTRASKLRTENVLRLSNSTFGLNSTNCKLISFNLISLMKRAN